MGKNYYDVLGIKRDASTKEVKKAYHKMALLWHPDRSGDHERFKEINEAYEVLSDSEKRQAYDLHGEVRRPPPHLSSRFQGGADLL